jgi:hypothetical protein
MEFTQVQTLMQIAIITYLWNFPEICEVNFRERSFQNAGDWRQLPATCLSQSEGVVGSTNQIAQLSPVRKTECFKNSTKTLFHHPPVSPE